MFKIFTRSFQVSAQRCTGDLTRKRLGHIVKKDKVEGEQESSIVANKETAISLAPENLLTLMFNGVMFKDIPILHIKCTRNNTKMTLTDGAGRMIGIKSAGTEGYKNCRKGTTVAAQAVAQRIVSKANDYDINQVRLVFNGLGPGRSAAFKVVELSGLNVVSLSDRTEADEPWIRRPRRPKSL